MTRGSALHESSQRAFTCANRLFKSGTIQEFENGMSVEFIRASKIPRCGSLHCGPTCIGDGHNTDKLALHGRLNPSRRSFMWRAPRETTRGPRMLESHQIILSG